MLFLKMIYFSLKYTYLYIFSYDKHFYDKLLVELSHINIIFIKIFQWLSSEKKINDKYLLLLKKYVDNCPYDDDSVDKETLINLIKYSNENNHNLELTSFIPYRSGSINLVFIAYLNNKKVVIKILRRNIIKKIEESIDFFYYIGNIFYIIFYIYNIQDIIYDIIYKNKNILIEQTNLKNELDNIKLFKYKYRNSNYLIIPNFYEEFTDKYNNLIVMDFIEGCTIDNIQKEDKEEFNKIYLKYTYSFLEKEIIHGDLHIGNILFCKLNNTEKNMNKIKENTINLLEYSIDKKLFSKKLMKKNIDINECDSPYIYSKENTMNLSVDKEHVKENTYKIGLIDFGIIHILNKNEIDLAYKLFKTTDIDDFLKTLIYSLKNFIKSKNKINNIDILIDILYKDIHTYYIENISNINGNLFDINAIKYILYRINYYNLEINERVANFIISLCIINSLSIYFTDIDSFTNNKNLNKKLFINNF